MTDKREELIGPWLQCEVVGCPIKAWSAAPFERHEIGPGVWRWVCFGDVVGSGLNEGK